MHNYGLCIPQVRYISSLFFIKVHRRLLLLRRSHPIWFRKPSPGYRKQADPWVPFFHPNRCLEKHWGAKKIIQDTNFDGFCQVGVLSLLRFLSKLMGSIAIQFKFTKTLFADEEKLFGLSQLPLKITEWASMNLSSRDSKTWTIRERVSLTKVRYCLKSRGKWEKYGGIRWRKQLFKLYYKWHDLKMPDRWRRNSPSSNL